MKTVKTYSAIFILSFISIQNAVAQVAGTPYITYMNTEIPVMCSDINTKGTDFWTTFGQNNEEPAGSVLMVLKIATETATSITLTFTEGGTYTFSAAANTVSTIDLSNVPTLGDKRNAVYAGVSAAGTTVSNKSLHITSTKPVSIYAFNTKSATTDATLLLPVAAWGTDYYRMSNALVVPSTDLVAPKNFYDCEMIIAREATTLTLPGGATRTLSAGQVYCNASTSEMTGRHITSDKPVAYFTHTTLSAVPAGRNFGDILFEQLMSVDRWGNQFLIPNAQQGGNSMNNLVRVIASEDGTKVNFSGAGRTGGQNISSGGTLNAGQWVELTLSSATGACYINSDKPTGVAAYLVGDGTKNNANYFGDPSIAWVPALNQNIQSVLITPFMFTTNNNNTHTNFDEPNSSHYAIVITKTATKTQTKINSAAITSNWTDNAASGCSYYIKKFDNTNDRDKTFAIENPNGVIVMVYGISRVESYYYNAGSGACVIN
ncbi:hypothetical protein FACS189429_0630 [Bacteroidia bacterium]|nr:hypothetical protein FACS189429_0630 [Bacteroidia bacterium]